jgi:hypothetical protein
MFFINLSLKRETFGGKKENPESPLHLNIVKWHLPQEKMRLNKKIALVYLRRQAKVIRIL